MIDLPWITFAAFVVASAAAGSISFALLIAKANKIDLRTTGSGNVGATNLGRALGFKAFLLCFLLDALKGFGPTLGFGLAAGWVGVNSLTLGPAPMALWLAVAIAAVLGHMFSPFIAFKGGKGVATAFGSLLGVFPALTVPAVGALLVFLAVFWIWRYVSLASILAAAALPVWVWYFYSVSATALAERNDFDELVEFPARPATAVGITAALALVVIWKHRSNISRLASGTENKIGRATPADRASG